MTLRSRVIPVLLLDGESLVKTRNFGNARYVGDPLNTVKIFNELEADELFVVDIAAARRRSPLNLPLLSKLAGALSMPFCYGGGIRRFEDADKVFRLGCEKVLINSALFEDPSLVSAIADVYGSQAIVAGLDVDKSRSGKYLVRSHAGRRLQKYQPSQWARTLERRGAGEILLTAIHREGTWSGIDIGLVADICANLSIPVVAHGGVSIEEDLSLSLARTGASAFGVGSALVYQGEGQGVLVHLPDHFRYLLPQIPDVARPGLT